VAYLIDTTIAIHARDGTDAVLDKLAEHDGEVLLSALSLAELQRGLYRYPAVTAIRQVRLEVLLRGIPVLPFDASAARAYGQIIAQCGWAKGRDYNRMIAAHDWQTKPKRCFNQAQILAYWRSVAFVTRSAVARASSRRRIANLRREIARRSYRSKANNRFFSCEMMVASFSGPSGVELTIFTKYSAGISGAFGCRRLHKALTF
jgi:tRNA(fMet)-specific endonuclease VapC